MAASSLLTRDLPCPKPLRHTLLSMRDLLATAGPSSCWPWCCWPSPAKVLDPNPPKKVVLATGADQGAYAEFGKRYAKALAQHGIQVELRGTAGAAENPLLLRSGVRRGPAFVQGGADMEYASQADCEAANADLMSLGSLFYEPVWLFYRGPRRSAPVGKPCSNRSPTWRGPVTGSSTSARRAAACPTW